MQPLRKALQLMGAHPSLVPESFDGQMSYSVTNYLRKLKKQVIIERNCNLLFYIFIFRLKLNRLNCLHKSKETELKQKIITLRNCLDCKYCILLNVILLLWSVAMECYTVAMDGSPVKECSLFYVAE